MTIDQGSDPSFVFDVDCSFLDHIEEHPTGKRNKHIIYQYFNMPWPLG